MPGFLSVINGNLELSKNVEDFLIVESFVSDLYKVERRAINKFVNDKVFYDSEDLLIVLDGVILNKESLVKKYEVVEWDLCLKNMYYKNGDFFCNELRGSFSGIIFNKITNTWIVFTDHIGDKQIFYFQTDNGILIGTEMSYMVESMKLNGYKPTINRDAAYMLITLGYVIEDKTLISEIHKLAAGCLLKINGLQLEEVRYHRFSNKPMIFDEKEAIERIDESFKNAVALQFEKDKEYGYCNLTCLSGGLDSRMTVWVAHQLGYTKQLNATFCQSNYIDFQVAQNIATDLHHDFIFKTLDSGNCLFDIDEVTDLTYGNACYFGVSHSKSMFDKLDYSKYGIVHSGMLGDVILGTYSPTNRYDEPYTLADGGFSVELIDRLSNYKFKYTYENLEMYKMYSRGFCFIGQGILGYGHTKTETLSPFCNVDFMELCFSIPLEMRFEHKIYIAWILAKYPEAAKYIWERYGRLITNIDNSNLKEKQVKIFGKTMPSITSSKFIPFVASRIKSKFKLNSQKEKQCEVSNKKHTFVANDKNNMNPIDYWYNTNDDLKNFMDNYWQKNKSLVRDKQILEDMAYLYNNSIAVFEKIQVLSLLAAIKKIIMV